MKSLITQERLKELFHYDPDTGFFTRLTSHNRWKKGQPPGYKNTCGHLEAGIDGNYYGLHRLAFLYMNGVWPNHEIDHIDGVKDNNKWANLREATRSMNMQNLVGARRDNKCGKLGVCWHKAAKAWVAQISISGKKIHLGVFSDIDEAHRAYIEAKRKLHKGCTL